MMRNPTPCPRCEEDELCLYRALNNITIFCAECGWRTTQPLVEGQSVDEQIVAAIRAAKEPADPSHGFYPGSPYPPVDSPIVSD